MNPLMKVSLPRIKSKLSKIEDMYSYIITVFYTPLMEFITPKY